MGGVGKNSNQPLCVCVCFTPSNFSPSMHECPRAHARKKRVDTFPQTGQTKGQAALQKPQWESCSSVTNRQVVEKGDVLERRC